MDGYITDNQPSFFDVIDTEIKAYVLGMIAAQEKWDFDNKCLKLHTSRYLDGLEYCFTYDGTYLISGKDFDKCCQLFQISNNSKEIKFPQFINDGLKWAFLRAILEVFGRVELTDDYFPSPKCLIFSHNKQLIQLILENSPIPVSYCDTTTYGKVAHWEGSSALDLLDILYKNSTVFTRSFRQFYFDLCTWNTSIKKGVKDNEGFCWCKKDPNAVAPFKARASDSGYDLTIIKKVKQAGMVEFFDTGISVQPPYGYYFDLVPRSSLSKTGYILVNSIGVLDSSYTGNILVPLLRLDHSFPPLELPARVVQIIPRPIIHLEPKEVDELGPSSRNDKGFGSSGK